MMQRFLKLLTFGALLSGAFLMLALGFTMPELRAKYVYHREQQRAENAVQAIATGERSLRRKTGKYETFSPDGFGPSARRLGIDWDTVPSDNFQFDAALLPGGHLRLRMLPRGDAVAALKIPAKLYAAELSESGSLVRSGWYP